MTSFRGPPTPANRGATERLKLPPSRGPVAVAVLVLVGLTFVIGFHLGGNGASPVVVPSHGIVASGPLANELPSATAPVIQPDAVSSGLAIAASGLVPRYGWALCVIDTTPTVCRMIRPATEPLDAFAQTGAPLPSLSARLAAIWRTLQAPQVPSGSHLVLVAPLIISARGALLVWVDGTEATQDVTPVEPGRGGINYFDLGALLPGPYLVAVVGETSSPPPTRFAQVVGLLACPSGLGGASPGCASAP